MGILSKLTGLGTLKIALMASLFSAGMAFYAGVRWEKGDRYDDAIATIEAMRVQTEENMATLNTRWQAAADSAKIQVQDWSLQNKVDQSIFDRLLAGQGDIRSKFDDINNEIYITTDLGTCLLSPDAVRLLRDSSAAANRTPGVPID